jgi:hypothetical protein
MADCMAAEILIGGRLPRSRVEAFCSAIQDQYLALDWGGGAFSPETAGDLMAAMHDSNYKDSWLRLTDDEARYGQFERLEEFLRKERIPYDRRSAGKYSYDAEIVWYRPGLGLFTCVTNMAGEPVVAVSMLRKVEKKLAALVAALGRGRVASDKVYPRVERPLKQLRKALPPDLPPLPAFEIEKEQEVLMPSPVIRAVAVQTGTAPGNWEHFDGPATGVGAEYWLRNTVESLEAYVCDDQGELTIEVTRIARDSATGHE